MSWLLILAGCGAPVGLDGTRPERNPDPTGTGTGATVETLETDTSTWTPERATDTAPVGPATCETWCACVVTTCDLFPQVEDLESCIARCDDMVEITQEELECWSAYCEHAAEKPEDQRLHLCEHAVGLLGLDECG